MKSLKSFSNFRPCKNNTELISSYGSKSFFADFKGVTFKIYECQNIMQLKLRQHISTCKNVSSFFPKIINVFEEELLVVEEFIEGETSTAKHNIKKDIDSLIEELYKIKFPETWDYIGYIYQRVNSTYKKLKIESKVNHNDLTYANIIINKFNHPIVVDNEFLACNNGWFMNKFNSNLFDKDDCPTSIPRDMFLEICKIRKYWKK